MERSAAAVKAKVFVIVATSIMWLRLTARTRGIAALHFELDSDCGHLDQLRDAKG